MRHHQLFRLGGNVAVGVGRAVGEQRLQRAVGVLVQPISGFIQQRSAVGIAFFVAQGDILADVDQQVAHRRRVAGQQARAADALGQVADIGQLDIAQQLIPGADEILHVQLADGLDQIGAFQLRRFAVQHPDVFFAQGVGHRVDIVVEAFQ